MTWTKLAILMLFTLAVSGCGGDSAPMISETTALQAEMAVEAEVDSAEVSAEPTAPAMSQEDAVVDEEAAIEEDEFAEERRLVEDAILEADAQAAPGQADAQIAVEEARLSVAADFLPYVPTSGHAEFDGQDVRVHLPIYVGGYRVVLNSAPDEVEGMAVSSRLAGYSRRVWTLSGNGPLAVVSVRWNDDDDNDYLAAGWWVRDTFGRNALESGVFFDGPEMRGPLPDSMEPTARRSGRLLRRSHRSLPGPDPRPLHVLSLRHSQRGPKRWRVCCRCQAGGQFCPRRHRGVRRLPTGYSLHARRL